MNRLPRAEAKAYLEIVDLRQVEYVEAVARHANFTRAAAELHVAQPALSAAIRRLEADLGVQLFNRTSRRVVVTPAGAAFLARAHRLMLDVEQLRGEMREYAEGNRGHLRISAWYHAEPEIALFLQEFLAENGLVEVSILELPTWDALDQLRARQLDLALIVVTKGLDLTGIDDRVVKTEPYVLVTAPADPLASRESVQVRELAGRPFIATREGTALRHCLDRVFAEVAEAPRIVIETNELAATVNFVSIGLGSAILTRSIAEHVGVPVSVIPLAGNSPFVLAAAWTAGPHNRLVDGAIELISSRGRITSGGDCRSGDWRAGRMTSNP